MGALILPPVPAYVDPYGPTIGIGLGVSAQAQEENRPLYLVNDGWRHRPFHRGFGHYYDTLRTVHRVDEAA